MDSLLRRVISSRNENNLSQVSEIASPESLEYSALKQEQQTRLVLRDTALYVTIGGALTSASLVMSVAPATELRLSQFLSYAAPLFSLSMFLIYFRNDYYVSKARRYITNELSPRIVDHFALSAGAKLADSKFERGFDWEEYHRSPYALWVVMRLITLFVLLAVFLSPIVMLYTISGSAEYSKIQVFQNILSATVSALIIIGTLRLIIFD